jgi:nucleoside-diphosphate-sugar epimerase
MMRVLIAGATGVVGRKAVPLLASQGHEVVALSRRPAPPTDPDVRTVVVDALDTAALANAVRQAQPDVVVHLLTAIPREINPRTMTKDFAMTNRLRSETTRVLIESARETGCSRVIGQSVAFAYDLEGARPERASPATEDTPLFRSVAKQWRTSLEAVQALEKLTLGAEDGVVLRFGHLYGPGTAFTKDGSTVAQIRGKKFRIGGKGTSVFSFTHTEDAAGAIAAALNHPTATGVFNVVDDEPAPTGEWVPELASILGAPTPSSVPEFMVRIFGGGWGHTYMTRLRGADNSRAKKKLDWQPAHPSWREGFRAELA